MLFTHRGLSGPAILFILEEASRDHHRSHSRQRAHCNLPGS
jgi:predicted flavoprotein YhiN